MAEYSSHLKRTEKPRSYLRAFSSIQNRRRSMTSSTPKPGGYKEDVKLTFDQATQTDESGPFTSELPNNNLADIAHIEDLVKQLYRQFTALISDFEHDDTVASVNNGTLENSETESCVATPNRVLANVAERPDMARQSSNESGAEQVISTSNVRMEAGTSMAKVVKVRRVSAHTTNTLDLSRHNDMVRHNNIIMCIDIRIYKTHL